MELPSSAMDTGTEIENHPDFAIIWSFFSKFGKQLEMEDIMISDVVRWISGPPNQSPVIIDIMVKLMRKTGMRVDKQRWQKHLMKVAAKNDYGLAAELQTGGFNGLSGPKKLKILKWLCEMQFDDNMKFKAVINNEDADEQRLKPVGRDEDGLVYWHQEDEDLNIRLYVEDEDEDDDSGWKVVCRTKEDIGDLIKRLTDEPADKMKGENSDEEEEDIVETKFQKFLKTQCTSESNDDKENDDFSIFKKEQKMKVGNMEMDEETAPVTNDEKNVKEEIISMHSKNENYDDKIVKMEVESQVLEDKNGLNNDSNVEFEKLNSDKTDKSTSEGKVKVQQEIVKVEADESKVVQDKAPKEIDSAVRMDISGAKDFGSERKTDETGCLNDEVKAVLESALKTLSECDSPDADLPHPSFGNEASQGKVQVGCENVFERDESNQPTKEEVKKVLDASCESDAKEIQSGSVSDDVAERGESNKLTELHEVEKMPKVLCESDAKKLESGSKMDSVAEKDGSIPQASCQSDSAKPEASSKAVNIPELAEQHHYDKEVSSDTVDSKIEFFCKNDTAEPEDQYETRDFTHSIEEGNSDNPTDDTKVKTDSTDTNKTATEEESSGGGTRNAKIKVGSNEENNTLPQNDSAETESSKDTSDQSEFSERKFSMTETDDSELRHGNVEAKTEENSEIVTSCQDNATTNLDTGEDAHDLSKLTPETPSGARTDTLEVPVPAENEQVVSDKLKTNEVAETADVHCKTSPTDNTVTSHPVSVIMSTSSQKCIGNEAEVKKCDSEKGMTLDQGQVEGIASVLQSIEEHTNQPSVGLSQKYELESHEEDNHGRSATLISGKEEVDAESKHGMNPPTDSGNTPNEDQSVVLVLDDNRSENSREKTPPVVENRALVPENVTAKEDESKHSNSESCSKKSPIATESPGSPTPEKTYQKKSLESSEKLRGNGKSVENSTEYNRVTENSEASKSASSFAENSTAVPQTLTSVKDEKSEGGVADICEEKSTLHEEGQQKIHVSAISDDSNTTSNTTERRKDSNIPSREEVTNVIAKANSSVVQDSSYDDSNDPMTTKGQSQTYTPTMLQHNKHSTSESHSMGNEPETVTGCDQQSQMAVTEIQNKDVPDSKNDQVSGGARVSEMDEKAGCGLEAEQVKILQPNVLNLLDNDNKDIDMESEGKEFRNDQEAEGVIKFATDSTTTEECDQNNDVTEDRPMKKDKENVCNGEEDSEAVEKRDQIEDEDDQEADGNVEVKRPTPRKRGRKKGRRPASKKKRSQPSVKKPANTNTQQTQRQKKPKLSRLEQLKVEAESILHMGEKKSKDGEDAYRTRSGRRVKNAKKEEPELWQTLVDEDSAARKRKDSEGDEEFQYAEKKKGKNPTPVKDKEPPEKLVKRIVEDDKPCMKCGLSTHPETILLCDGCDKGHHMACLTPPLMIVPYEEWFCPKCGKEKLIAKLKEIYNDLEEKTKLHKRKTRQSEYKKLLNDYTGISTTNIIPEQTKPEKPKPVPKKRKQSFSSVSDSDDMIVGDSYSSPSSPDIKTTRRCRTKVSYDFSTFDKTIMDAIKDDIDIKSDEPNEKPISGKDIRTIIAAEKGEDAEELIEENDSFTPGRRKKRKLTNLNSSEEEASGSHYSVSESDDEMTEEEFKESENTESEESLGGGRGHSRRRKKPFVKPIKRSRRLRRKRIQEEVETSLSESSTDYEEVAPKKKKLRRRGERNGYGRESSEDEYVPPRVMRDHKFIDDDDGDDGDKEEETVKDGKKKLRKKRVMKSSSDEDGATKPEKGKTRNPKDGDVSSDDWSSLSSNAAQSSEDGSVSEADSLKRESATAKT